MQQRQKEYLSFNKKQKEKFYVQLQEESTRSDSAKRYFPKQSKVVQLVGKNAGNMRSTGVLFFGSLLRFIFICVIVCSLFLGGCYFKNEIDYSFKRNSSLKNGIGLNAMATTLFDIRADQTETLSEFIASDFSFSENEIQNWKTSISEDLNTIENLSYHRSYSKVVNGYVSLLEMLQTYIDQMEDGDIETARLTLKKYYILINEQKYILAQALEKNGVSHSVTDTDIRYSYFAY